jgi:molybdopterin molybdotransferase
MIRPEDAWSRIEPFARPLDAESAPRRQALGRRLAAPLVATTDLPPLDVSALDGFALTGATAAGTSLAVAFTVRAGDAGAHALAAGQAAAIMTGAPLPRGADRVIGIEATEVDGERIRILASPAAGAAVRRGGEVVRAGATLLPAGALLRPAAMGLLASQGIEELALVRRPRVALLATGDEVVPAGIRPGRGQVRDSHTAYLEAACRREGADPRPLGIAPDREAELRRLLVAAGDRTDVILVCGGVSRGEFDLVEPVATALGYRFLFDAVAIQPGKPLAVAVREGRLLFGLPGNPASAMVTFELFVAPFLRRLAGDPAAAFWSTAIVAELEGSAPAARERDRFLPASLLRRDGRLVVRSIGHQGSHDLAAFARAEGLLRVPRGQGGAPSPGDPLEVLPLDPG